MRCRLRGGDAVSRLIEPVGDRVRIEDSRSVGGDRRRSRLIPASARRGGLALRYGEALRGLLRGGVRLRRAKVF